jgi:tetratricopeptide (TPR) repeat protein
LKAVTFGGMPLSLVLALALAADRPDFLSAGQMIKLMEASPRHYELAAEENAYEQWAQQNAAISWPEGQAPIDMVAVTPGPNGHPRVEPYPEPPEATAALAKVEPLFEAKDWSAAEKGYAEVAAKFPGDYAAFLDWGDASLFGGKPEAALAHYDKAIALNPADHRGWYFRGNALAKLGRKKDALESYVQALARRPGNTTMLLGLEPAAEQLGYQVRPRSMLPRARVTAEGDGARIATAGTPWWMGWGVCKALWLGEADHRKAMTGAEKHVFTAVEEQECLANLIAIYRLEQKSKKSPAEPALDRLAAVSDAKLLNGYIVWEIASRISPNVYLQQAPDLQRQVEEYVRRFILVKR